MHKRSTWLGAGAALALYLAGLGLHLTFAGLPLRPHPGIVDPGQTMINLPARAVAAVAAIPSIAPQGIGKIDGQTAAAAEKSWSPVAFVLLGLTFYGALGAAGGAGLGALRARRKAA